MTNKELETKIKDRLKKLSKDTIIELYLQARIEKDLPSEIEESPNHNFKVGDRVQFKSWEEMEKEYGLDRDENISLDRPRFLKCMTNLCGTYATIKKNDKGFVWLKDFTADGDTEWDYSLNMLKPATDEPKCKFKVGDKVKVAVDYDDKLNNKIGIIRQTCECDVPISYLIDFDKKLDSVWISEKCLEPYTEPRWTFTDDEKVILRNLDVDYKWIARDRDGILCAYFTKPRKLKSVDMWDCDTDDWCLAGFNHLFQSIKWTDDEACEFRKYL